MRAPPRPCHQKAGVLRGSTSCGGRVNAKFSMPPAASTLGSPAVWPNVQAWAGVVAHLDKPSVTMRLTPDTQTSDFTAGGYMTARIVALQDLIQEG